MVRLHALTSRDTICNCFMGGVYYISVVFSWTFESVAALGCRHKVDLLGEFAPQFGHVERKSSSILDRRE